MRCNWLVILVVVVLAVAMTAGPLLAKEGTEGQESGKGLFTWALDLGIWTIVVFVVLLFILKRFAWGPMLEGLHKREHNIQAAIEESRRAREEAERLRAQFQREMNQAAEKVREILDEARRDGQRIRDQMQSDGRREIQSERDRALRDIGTARDQALKELMDHSAHLATQISAKVIRRDLSLDDHRRLVDEALAELAQANVGWKEKSLF